MKGIKNKAMQRLEEGLAARGLKAGKKKAVKKLKPTKKPT